MMNFSKLSVLAIGLFVAMTISCSKEGAQGPAGSNGTNGKDGNANVMYSDWITFTANFTDVPTLKMMRVTVPQYTNGFIDSGGLYLAFVRWQDNVHFQLPLSNRFNSTSSPVVEIYAYGVSFNESGELRFSAKRADAGALQTEFTSIISSNRLEVRYFLLKGTTNLRLANGMSAHDYYKSKTYEEICALTGANP